MHACLILQTVMVLTIVVVVAFRTSARLGLAFGLAVNCDFLVTSFFLVLVRSADTYIGTCAVLSAQYVIAFCC